MADKEMTARNVLTEMVPNVVLIFHTLRAFRREISSNKMGVNAAQCNLGDNFYAQIEEEYLKFYQLKDTKLKYTSN